jgi:hypothetical protein
MGAAVLRPYMSEVSIELTRHTIHRAEMGRSMLRPYMIMSGCAVSAHTVMVNEEARHEAAPRIG